MVWLAIYIVVAIILFVIVEIIDTNPDDWDVFFYMVIATMWPIVLPILLFFGLSYCLIKLGNVIGKKIWRHTNG